MSCAVPVTPWIEAVVSCDRRRGLGDRRGEAARCSPSPARSRRPISLIDDTSSSADAAIDSACVAVSLQRRRHLVRRAPAASSSARDLRSRRPPTTSSVMRAMSPAEAVTRSACSSTRPMSKGARRCRCARPLAVSCRRGHYRLSCECWSASPLDAASTRSVASNRASRSSTTIMRSPSVAMPRRYCAAQARQRSFGGLIAAGGNREELARGVDDQPDCAATRLHDEQPGAHVVRHALEPEARAQVDRRHDLAAREHDAVDERAARSAPGDVVRPSRCAPPAGSAARTTSRRPRRRCS